MPARRPESATLIALAVTLVLWASAFAGIKEGLRGYGPGELALLRFATASAVLAVWAAIKHLRLPAQRDLPKVLLAGMLGISIYHVALNFGERTVSAGAASLLIAAGPVFTALMATLFLGERLSGWGWGGIAVAFGGVALITLGGRGGTLSFQPGALLVLLSAVVTAAYFVVSKPLLRRYTALEFTSYAIWAGTLPMLVFAPGLVRQLPAAPLSTTLAVIYLGVFPAAVAYVLWSYALSKAPASIVSSTLYVSPVLAILIAWLWIGEVPSLLSLLGGAIALGGVTIVNTLGARRATA